MKKLQIIIGLILLVTVMVRCSRNSLNTIADFRTLPLAVTTPADNLQTAQKIALGKLLFWDPVLSGKKDVACASCHHPLLEYGDARDLSIGVNGQGLGTARHFLSPNNIPFAKRNALSIINTAFNGINADGFCNASTASMFFDNRVRSLELQSLEPMKTLEEMKGGSISKADILDSIVLRLIISNHSPYDEYIRGNKSAMTSAQIQGMNTFASNGCIKCHSGPMFSDYALHVLSVPDNPKLATDAGPMVLTHFRTPSLRNLSLTAPYMHSGVFNNLDAVLDFYEKVGDHRSQNNHVSNNQLEGSLQRINERDKSAIIQFFGALNDAGFDRSIPTAVPSGLHPGGNLQ